MPIDLRDLPQPPKAVGQLLVFVEQLARHWRHNMLQLKAFARPYISREQERYEVWAGGVAIFQKTIPITEAFCETDATAIAHGIAAFGRLVRMEGFFNDGANWYPLPYSTGAASINLFVNGTNLISMVGGAPSFTSWAEGYVTLWYTKA